MTWLVLEDPAQPGRFVRCAYVAGANKALMLGLAGASHTLDAAQLQAAQRAQPSSASEPASTAPENAGPASASPRPDRPRPAAAPAMQAPNGAAEEKIVRAPAAGKVSAVLVAAGERVAAGQVVVLLEAMKVEVPVRARLACLVGEVCCREGAWVDPGEALLHLG